MSKVQHFDFPVIDEDRAKHFYTHIFGWKINEIDMEDKKKYHMITTGSVDENGRGNEVNTIGGGFYKRSKPEDSLTLWVTVPSIEEVIQMVKNHGGKELMPKTNMGMGYGAKIEDPDGNAIGLWEEKR